VEGVNKVLTMHMGAEDILVNISVDFADSIPSERIEKVIAAIDRQFKAINPAIKRVFVEAEARTAGGKKPS
jgi:hypothetical protein